MSTKKTVVQAGAGKMGSIWVDSWDSSPAEIVGIIDPQPKEKIRQTYQSQVYNNIDEFEKENMTPDILSIATPPKTHKKYLRYGINMEIPNIITEKPSTESTTISKQLAETSSSQISVDYIETKHSVLQTIIDEMEPIFNLTRAFHWRGKEPRNFNPYIRDDLIHDISELYLVYNHLDRNFSDLQISDAIIKSWAESTDRFTNKSTRTNVDVNANVKLNGSHNEDIQIRGGFDEPTERRYFIWIDDMHEVAYIGNTLNRSHITPVVARISGAKNIETAYNYCTDGLLKSDAAFSELFDRVDATEFQLSEYSKQVQKITHEISDGQTSPVSLDDAIEIESLADQIYTKSMFEKPM